MRLSLVKFAVLLVCLFCSCSRTASQPPASVAVTTSKPVAQPLVGGEDERSLGYVMLLYLPNRVVDLFDIVRLRLRLGPGLAAGVRATDVFELFAGEYFTVFAGLPGPRLSPVPKLPFGFESYSGEGANRFREPKGEQLSPDYSPTEFGFGLQTLIVGADAGLDPFEALDFFAGFLLMDPAADDF